MRVMVLGIRGMPKVQGGVETHAEQLYQRLAASGCQIDVIVRTPFVPKGASMPGSIRLHRIWSPRKPGLEAFIHSVLGVLYAGIARPDILHIHAVGPAVVTPLARLLGLRVVVTHHGPDYDRDKWGRFARWLLRLGESFGMRFSHERIAISRVIVNLIREKYRLDATLIHNGVVPVTMRADSQILNSFGLTRDKYFLQVSRLVPEKRQLDLIQAFVAAQLSGWKLVLVGSGDGSGYSAKVHAAAEADAVVMTGFMTGEPLAQIYSHAGVFVLPSTHEGLPIAMLEALSYGLPVIASDIPANLEVGLDVESYFRVGDIESLARRLRAFAAASPDAAARAARRAFVADRYDWDRIASATLSLYRKVLQR